MLSISGRPQILQEVEMSLAKLSFGDVNKRVKARYNVLCENMVCRRGLEHPSPSMEM